MNRNHRPACTWTVPNTTPTHFQTNALTTPCFIISRLNNHTIPSTRYQHTADYPRYSLPQKAASIAVLICFKLFHSTHTASVPNASVRRNILMFCGGKTWCFHTDGGEKWLRDVSAQNAAVQHTKITTPKQENTCVVGFLLGNSPASEFYMSTFRNTLYHLPRQVAK
jgi:hypothetical protein